ncbi:sodium/sulfate symporter [Chloropicon primus]|uniref:Sodium/sulfate symporter n=1 Tax=Chloropicon primus TaxID=1764295 RepID=A0A5B8MJE1_9CHLO|nr:sodium/sulfate symporter [Chloropicon primus]UPQ99759.1 sodium/sulfate symporter [Chloropicon primus]|mmetsp:Transcript_2778/g.7617  ORF Transcript_2778/g.7617 Transcript_2778/m.7617 type:complete len:602 (-) Transcript_2778:61-1866(-)|eukprot:QDZ20547.1 sodium/sulfate symporter [Chloropicon primus]
MGTDEGKSVELAAGSPYGLANRKDKLRAESAYDRIDIEHENEPEASTSQDDTFLLPHKRRGEEEEARPRGSQWVYCGFLLAGPAVFGLSFISRGKELPTAALVLWVALWWVTEILPLGLTAFVPAVVLPLMGVCKATEVTACYMNPTIMLFVQSFLLASCVHKYNLHKRVALNVMLITGTKPGGILLGSIMITATLSMWMSNTSTSAMMVPLVMSLYETLIKREKDEEAPLERSGENGGATNSAIGNGDERRGSEVSSSEDVGRRRKDAEKFGKGLMLSVAYSASIGGTATPIGTGPNLVLMQTWENTFGESPGFLSWLGFGFTYAALMLAVLWTYLYFFFTTKELPRATDTQLRSMLRDLGPYSFPEKVVTSSILIVMFLWMTRKKPLWGWGDALKAGGASVHDYMPVMAAAILLSVVPETNPFGRKGKGLGRKGKKILDMSAFRDVSWGVVFLLGGGFALSLGIERSGLMENITSALEFLKAHVGKFVFPLLIASSVTFATEFVSNVAMSTIILPVLANIGAETANLGLIPAALACSCAFMLPSATPPNALAYGSGLLSVYPDMVWSGLVMNVTGITLITFWSVFVAPIFFPENSTGPG